MQIDGWKYYNHAVVPKASPHEVPDMLPVENGDIWKAGGGVGKVDDGFRLRL